MRTMWSKFAASVVAAALIASPTMASATAAATAQPTATSWVALSQMTPAGAMALAGSGAVAGTPDAATVAASAAAVQPYEGDERRANPLPLPVIAVLLAVLGTAIYIAFIEKHHGHATFPGAPPVSPS